MPSAQTSRWAQVTIPGLKGYGTPFSALCSDYASVVSVISQKPAPRRAALRAPAVSWGDVPGYCERPQSRDVGLLLVIAPPPMGPGTLLWGRRVQQHSLAPKAEPGCGCEAPRCLPGDLEWDSWLCFPININVAFSLGTFLTSHRRGLRPGPQLSDRTAVGRASALSRSRQAGAVLTRHVAPCPALLVLLFCLNHFRAFPGEPE